MVCLFHSQTIALPLFLTTLGFNGAFFGLIPHQVHVCITNNLRVMTFMLLNDMIADHCKNTLKLYCHSDSR